MRARWRDVVQRLPALLRGRGELVALALAALLLAAALFKPSLPGERPLFDHVIVLDVTQSMDVRDVTLDGRQVSRLAAAKSALHAALLALPCGSRVGWGIFTEHRTLLMLAPLEVCEHLGELRGTLALMDGRMAWSGNSEVAKGLHSALKQIVLLKDKPSLVFITDGHESPPLDARQRPRFDGTPGDVAGVLLGAGGVALQPIPRSDPMGRPIGTWRAEDVMQTDPFSASRGGSVAGEGMSSESAARPAPGATPGREHLSSLREGYLRLLAGETGLAYAPLGDAASLARLLTGEGFARPVPARIELHAPLAGTALLVLLLPYLRGLRGLRMRWRPGAAAPISAARAPGTPR